LRIVAGEYRGRSLVVPSGPQVRPTTERVRESIFNILGHSERPPKDARVLDLFAGSGALGLEALSRGASTVLFVEINSEARAAIRQNIETLQATGHTRLYRRDATSLGDMPPNRGGAFNLVFLDAPYGQSLGEKALMSAIVGGWLTPDAFVVFECGKSEDPDLSNFQIIDERIYGETKVLFFRRRVND
jgi:16S rRNA (guanine966-N2)-methyltransferase